ncbi:hypothetical protein [Aestuariibius sp. HNIBRBA575]|uniref:hypothetical protein n=1 Tax=Aestuariibius sp. HNIBRBA575 TaxID=3233343 RepID=UPI0034A117C0
MKQTSDPFGIGHNNGPALDAGVSWRKHSWTKARADLLPKLPIEILRNRVKRARELGLPYKTYASVRASTGRDVIGFLFSTNALRLIRQGDRLPTLHADKLAGLVDTDRVALVQHPHSTKDVRTLANLDAAHSAPRAHAGWAQSRDMIVAALRDRGAIGDAYLMIGDTHFEREWAVAGKMAGFFTSDRYFELTK